ncbi:unnamed protein product, partial [Polarella glacialis]
AAAAALVAAPRRWAVARPGSDAENKKKVQVVVTDLPPEKLLPARRKVWLARKTLQRIDDLFLELMAEDKGAAVRLHLLEVINELGSLPKLAQELLDESSSMDSDALLPLVDSLGTQLQYAVTWTSEGDDCWNASCNVQELDEARDSFLAAVDMLLQIESL